MIIPVALLLAGLLLSAFFSGTETGFYRATRLRLVVDALAGNWVAKGLLWLSNRPTMFVATVLVGNNLANNLTSLAIVLLTTAIYPNSSLPQMIAPIVLAPLLFIYGELLPKNLFYQAPNRLLRRSGPPILLCTLLFMPLTLLLWTFSRMLEWIAGESPQKAQLALARRELQQMFDEGLEAGVLQAAQRGLAQGLFAQANLSVSRFAIPPSQIPKATTNMSLERVKELARKHRLIAIPFEDPKQNNRITGYLKTVDLYLQQSDELPELRSLIELSEKKSHLAALMQMEGADETMARVVNANNQTIGYVTLQTLNSPLFR